MPRVVAFLDNYCRQCKQGRVIADDVTVDSFPLTVGQALIALPKTLTLSDIRTIEEWFAMAMQWRRDEAELKNEAERRHCVPEETT